MVSEAAVALGDRATGVRERPFCSPRRAANPAYRRIQPDGEVVLLGQRLYVAPHVVGYDAFWVLVQAAAGDVKVFVVEEHPRLGLFGGGRAFMGELLNELGDWRYLAVHLFIEAPIELDGSGDTGRAYDDATVRVMCEDRFG